MASGQNCSTMPWLLVRVVAHQRGFGLFSVNLIVRSSTAEASLRKLISAVWTILSWLSRTTLNVKATSLDVNGVPSLHSMPLRNLRVISVKSGLYCHDSASQFSYSPVSTSNMMSGSAIVCSAPLCQPLTEPPTVRTLKLAKSGLVPLAPPWMARKVWLRGTFFRPTAAAGAAVGWAGAWVAAAAAGALVAAGAAGAVVGAAAGGAVAAGGAA